MCIELAEGKDYEFADAGGSKIPKNGDNILFTQGFHTAQLRSDIAKNQRRQHAEWRAKASEQYATDMENWKETRKLWEAKVVLDMARANAMEFPSSITCQQITRETANDISRNAAIWEAVPAQP